MSWVLLIFLSSYGAGGSATLGTFYALESCEAAKVAFLDATKSSYRWSDAHCIAVQGLRSAK